MLNFQSRQKIVVINLDFWQQFRQEFICLQNCTAKVIFHSYDRNARVKSQFLIPVLWSSWLMENYLSFVKSCNKKEKTKIKCWEMWHAAIQQSWKWQWNVMKNLSRRQQWTMWTILHQQWIRYEKCVYLHVISENSKYTKSKNNDNSPNSPFKKKIMLIFILLVSWCNLWSDTKWTDLYHKMKV